MKPDAHKAINRYRILTVNLASGYEDGNNGAFLIPVVITNNGREVMLHDQSDLILTIVVSDQDGWDHVSVSLPNRVPSWAEMCFVKDLFFDAEEPAMQLHPPRSRYVNHHENVLHLWRPYNRSIPFPPLIMV